MDLLVLSSGILGRDRARLDCDAQEAGQYQALASLSLDYLAKHHMEVRCRSMLNFQPRQGSNPPPLRRFQALWKPSVELWYLLEESTF